MGARRNWTKGEIDRMISLRSSGRTLREIASEFDTWSGTVKGVLVRNGVNGTKKSKPGPKPGFKREVKPYSFQEIALVPTKAGPRVAVIVTDSHSLKDVLAGLWE